MTTGKINYSPDYKSEKPMAKYRSDSIFGGTEMDLSDGPTWKVSEPNLPEDFGRMRAVCADGQHRFLPDAPKCGCGARGNPEVERAQLRDAVVEAAMKRHDAQSDYWDAAYKGADEKYAAALAQADIDLRAATLVLREFEQKTEVKRTNDYPPRPQLLQ